MKSAPCGRGAFCFLCLGSPPRTLMGLFHFSGPISRVATFFRAKCFFSVQAAARNGSEMVEEKNETTGESRKQYCKKNRTGRGADGRLPGFRRRGHRLSEAQC